jgi:hypothetical protein
MQTTLHRGLRALAVPTHATASAALLARTALAGGSPGAAWPAPGALLLVGSN